jgi:hypothetical protein
MISSQSGEAGAIFVQREQMLAYTVRKSGPNTDKEFQAYTELLEEIGIDLAKVPRVLEPGTPNRWLYVWKSKPQAERFARVLCSRLHDNSWAVHEFEVSREESGPLAPLTIVATVLMNGTVFRLEPSSQARIMQHYPNARLIGEVVESAGVVFPHDARNDFERQHGSIWDQVIILLTGISDEEVASLGGVRIVTPNGDVIHEHVPATMAQ